MVVQVAMPRLQHTSSRPAPLNGKRPIKLAIARGASLRAASLRAAAAGGRTVPSSAALQRPATAVSHASAVPTTSSQSGGALASLRVASVKVLPSPDGSVMSVAVRGQQSHLLGDGPLQAAGGHSPDASDRSISSSRRQSTAAAGPHAWLP
jgi:hypothetical protein